MDSLGEKLRTRARELGLSDTEVARRLDLSQSRYSNYVVDKREPDLATFVRICRVLGTRPDVLLGFGPPLETSEEERLRQEILDAALSMNKRALTTLVDVARALAGRHEDTATSGN